MMKKIFQLSVTVAFLFLLWGCPYQSLIPLGDATEVVTEKIIGEWVPTSETEKENPSYYVIKRSDSVNYSIQHFEYSNSDGNYTVKHYVAFTSTIDKNVFLNMQEVGHKDFLIHKIELKDGGLTLFEVTDNIDEEFSDRAKMRVFFKKYAHLSFFYNKEEVVMERKQK